MGKEKNAAKSTKPAKPKREPFIWITTSSPSKLLRAFVVSFICVFTIYCAIVYEPSQFGIWFADVDEPILLGDVEAGAIVRQVVDGIFAQKNTRPDVPGLLKDRRPRIVLLSLSNGDQAAKVILGRGRGIVAATEDAIRKSREPMNRLYDPRWVKIDIVQQASTEPGFQFGGAMALTRASQGIAFPRKTQLAFLPEELVAYSLVDDQHKLQADKIAEYLKNDLRALKRFKRLDPEKPVPVYWFSTISFFTDGNKYLTLKNGQRESEGINAAVITQAVKLGTEFLYNAMNSEGRFLVTSVPGEALALKYDYYQHASTLWALMQSAEVSTATLKLEELQRGVGFLMRHTPSDLGELGMGVAVAAKWYQKYPATISLPTVEEWATALRSRLQEDGSFQTDDSLRAKEYPGAAVLGLWEWYRVNKQAEALAAVNRAATYLITKRDRNLPDARLLPDRWLARTLSGLYQGRQEPVYLDHLQRLAGAVLASQNRSPLFPAWKGSFFQPPDLLATGKRADLICESYRMVRKYGKKEVADKLFESVESAAAFQIQNQFLPEKVLYVSRPDLKLGGFPRGLSDYRISLENVHSNLGGLSCYLDALTY